MRLDFSSLELVGEMMDIRSGELVGISGIRIFDSTVRSGGDNP